MITRHAFLPPIALGLLLLLPAVGRTEDCSELLKYAGETWHEKSSSDKAESVVTWFCSRTFDSESAATAASANASIPVEGIIIGGGFNNSDSSFAQHQRELCSTTDSRHAAAQKSEMTISTINPTVGKAVDNCISSRAVGIWASLEQTLNPSVFKVRIAKKGIDAVTKLSSFGTEPQADCRPPPKADQRINSSGLEISCTRSAPETPVTVTINTTGVGLTWATASSLPSPTVWSDKVMPKCNPGGAAFIFPVGHITNRTGTLFVDAVIKQAANCKLASVNFDYDCNWPAPDVGPTWKRIPDGRPERPLANGDVPIRTGLDLVDLRDGRANAVPVGSICQLRATVQYGDGHQVPNYTTFTYGSL